MSKGCVAYMKGDGHPGGFPPGGLGLGGAGGAGFGFGAGGGVADSVTAARSEVLNGCPYSVTFAKYTPGRSGCGPPMSKEDVASTLIGPE